MVTEKEVMGTKSAVRLSINCTSAEPKTGVGGAKT